MTARRIAGGCLCGAVQFFIDGALTDPLNCHCRMCRKAQGVAFRSRASVDRAAFRFVCGEQHLRAYESSPGERRMFCRTCGAPIMTRFDRHPDVLGIPLGPLDAPVGVKPARHVYTAYRAPWDRITDDLPQSPRGSRTVR